MIRGVFCSLFLMAGAFAQQAAPLPSGNSEEALRARVMQFYQDFVDGKFRAADALVADDSKDAFFAEEKTRYKSCSAPRLKIAADGKTAVATISCEGTWSFHGQRVPVPIPIVSDWELQNGDWFWRVRPIDTNPMTPFGRMKVDPDGQHQKGIPADPGAMAPGMLTGVHANKVGVLLPSDHVGHDEVEIVNNMEGVVRLSLAKRTIPGLKIQLSTETLAAKQKAVVSFDYTPPKGGGARNFSVTVHVTPTQQLIPIRVNFSAKTTAQK